jgi:hypothetical protein
VESQPNGYCITGVSQARRQSPADPFMARTMAGTATVDVADRTNAAMAEYQLAWRLVPVN